MLAIVLIAFAVSSRRSHSTGKRFNVGQFRVKVTHRGDSECARWLDQFGNSGRGANPKT
jgi:hypothetical protein